MGLPYVIVGEARNQREIQAALDAATLISREQLRTGGIPPIYASGVVYERENRRGSLPGVERIQTALDSYRLGHCDCDGMGPWRAAELQQRGVPARAIVRPSAVGYHVVVQRRDGIEDPSAVLGMSDGHLELAGDARITARARRRRMFGRLMRRAKSALEVAKRLGTGTAQGRAAALVARRAAALAAPLARREASPHDPSRDQRAELEVDTDELAAMRELARASSDAEGGLYE